MPSKAAEEIIRQALSLSTRERAAIAWVLAVGLLAGTRRRLRVALDSLRSRFLGVNWQGVDAEWERGKDETLIFWSSRAAEPERFNGFRIRFDPKRRIIKEVARHIAPGNDPVRILDVGSGPATNLGYCLPGRAVEMTCIDVMAVPFAELLHKHGLKPPVTPLFGTAEGVAEQFPAGHFDIVMSRNALDHVRDPFKALQAMLAVTKPDGCVIVWGHVNEGEAENYRGYHQWNFCWEHGDFIIWRPGHRQSVRTLLGDGLNFRSEGTDKLYRIVISRRAIA